MLLSSNVEDDKMISVMIRMIFDDRSARQVSDILIIRIGFFFFPPPSFDDSKSCFENGLDTRI